MMMGFKTDRIVCATRHGRLRAFPVVDIRVHLDNPNRGTKP